MRIEFWGVRGSIPVPGSNTVRYGGNTSCVSVKLGDHWVVFDAGTGIRPLGKRIVADQTEPEVWLFLSHVHWDHIQGFPFFAPAFHSSGRIRIHGSDSHDRTLSSILGGQMEGPNFPVGLDQMGGQVDFHSLVEGAIQPLYGKDGEPFASIANARLHHPNGVLGYRLVERSSGASVVYATDTEHHPGRIDDTLVQLASGADVLIYDGMYTPEEYPARQGWGHSTWKEGFRVARAAGVSHLVVFHHDPERSDELLDALARQAASEAASIDPEMRISFAREGDILDLPQ
ncbi:MAG: MBL fold metallo-hydrolase [Fibrobacteria bacterium]|nr:MBL fold metallo-hydrolase [Fibrobacteria bacterium]